MASYKVRLGQVKWEYLSYMNYVEILCAGILCMFKYCFVCLDNVCSITCTLKYCMLKKVFVQKLSAEICVCPKICRSWEHYSSIHTRINSKILNYLYEENCRSRNIDSTSSKFLEFKTFIFSQPSAMSANVTLNLTFMHSIFEIYIYQQ